MKNPGNKSSPHEKNIDQIDFLKAVAIFCVIILHTLPKKVLIDTKSFLHLSQAVPIFLIILGFNKRLSIVRKKRFENLYSKEYFVKEYNRIVHPYIYIYTASIILGLVTLWVTGKNPFFFGLVSAFGMLPCPGPGNYFVLFLLQYILLFPLLNVFYYRYKYTCVALCFLIPLMFTYLFVNVINLTERLVSIVETATPFIEISRIFTTRPYRLNSFYHYLMNIGYQLGHGL